MSRFPSRLSRQELYSYGFKEGESWGEDRRALESALREIDQHEREIQENYIYNRPAYSSSNPWSTSPAPRHYPGTNTVGHLPPRLYPPDIRMNRSNESESDSYASSESSVARWSGRNNGYGHGRAYREFPVSPGHGSTQSGRPNRFYSCQSGVHDAPADFHRPSRTTAQNHSNQNFAPPLSSSASSHGNFNALEDSPNFSEAPCYHPDSVPLSSPRHTTSATRTFSPSSQMQLIRYDSDHGEPSQAYEEDTDPYIPPPPTSLNAASPRWSATTTRGTGSESLSVDSSGGSHSEDSALSGYTDASISSGYVESYDVHSHGGYYHDHRNHDVEGVDQDYMSDGVASDEGVYYSSGEEPEDGIEGEEVYSDEGYYSESYSEDDGGYSDYE